LNVSFVGENGSELLSKLEGVPPNTGMGAVRFSLGRSTTWEDIEYVLEFVGNALGTSEE
jgi:cysteine sulfinate desulfinase/cysteine desulfurase-like protein